MHISGFTHVCLHVHCIDVCLYSCGHFTCFCILACTAVHICRSMCNVYAGICLHDHASLCTYVLMCVSVLIHLCVVYGCMSVHVCTRWTLSPLQPEVLILSIPTPPPTVPSSLRSDEALSLPLPDAFEGAMP